MRERSLYPGAGRLVDVAVFKGGAELGARRLDIALPVLAGEHRAATLTPGRVPQR